MKNHLALKKRNLFPVLLISFCLMAFSSCVSLLPTYNAQLAEEIVTANKAVDKFYLTMLEIKTDNDGRSFDKFAPQYINIEVELNALLNKNKVRPLNANSTRICEITLQLWVKYKQEHKTKNTLSDGLIQLNRKTFTDLFYAMQVAEKAKDMTSVTAP
jgi:hypothetical protein